MGLLKKFAYSTALLLIMAFAFQNCSGFKTAIVGGSGEPYEGMQDPPLSEVPAPVVSPSMEEVRYRCFPSEGTTSPISEIGIAVSGPQASFEFHYESSGIKQVATATAEANQSTTNLTKEIQGIGVLTKVSFAWAPGPLSVSISQGATEMVYKYKCQ